MIKKSMIKMFTINSSQIYGISTMISIFMVIFCYLITKLYKVTCAKPVSYTHLDVYKRQGFSYCHKRYVPLAFDDQTYNDKGAAKI